MHARRQAIKCGACRRAVAQQDIHFGVFPSTDLVLVPLVAEAHTIGPCSADAGDTELTEPVTSPVDIAHEAEVWMVVITRHVEHVDAQSTHHLERSVHTQQVVHATGLRLLVPPTGAGEVTHQEHTIELRTTGEGIEHLIEQTPPRVDVPDDAENGTQRTGFICIRP